MKFKIPPLLAIEERCNQNIIQQLLIPGYELEATVKPYKERQVIGYKVIPQDDSNEPILIVTGSHQPPAEYSRVIRYKGFRTAKTKGEVIDLEKGKWICHPDLPRVPKKPIDYHKTIEETIASWKNAFAYVEEDQTCAKKGMRLVQVGAVHAIHAHWAVSNKVATIVMPTGTGKTEVMLCALTSKPCSKLLVVVPSDALRTQIAERFLTLGLLKDCGVLSDGALYPIVGTLKHKPKSLKDVDSFFRKCNIIVTTMSIAGLCSETVQERMAYHCPYLFIDEAHHTPAQTWRAFTKKFEARHVLQFTATPFRSDDKPVEGDIIFNYRLRKAQEDGYFRRIQFKPVCEYDPEKADLAIAKKAVAQLRKDNKKYKHILMARVNNIARAADVFSIYKKYSEFKPVQMHTGIKSARQKEEVRRAILTGKSRIVVCVDMLGEGFDLPELKIAAFHDVRKSLPVTLQLAGRFTRHRDDIGDATFIANIADVNVRDELQKLYVQDADWNSLLDHTSDDTIKEQVALWRFIKGFSNFPEEIPLQNIRPALSTAVYRTTCKNWNPANFRDGIVGIQSVERIHYDINSTANTLVILTARKVPIDWVQVRDIFNWDWELYLVFWDKDQNLLFINSSTNRGYYRTLAKAIAGDVNLIQGPPVFRCFSGINRLKLQNVGLIEQLGRLIRYTMRAGSDVEPSLSEAQKRNTMRSNIFGVGYENGSKTSVGCSYKGRIWSHNTANVETLTKWCRFVGKKITDESIDPDEVLRGTLRPVLLSRRPREMPFGIDWPDIIYREPETKYSITIRNHTIPLYETDISLQNPTESDDLVFKIHSGTLQVSMKLLFYSKDEMPGYQFSALREGRSAIICGGKEILLDEFFYDNPPMIWFADGSCLEGNTHTPLNTDYSPYPVQKIQVWDWTGVDITKESQGVERRPDSIQYHVIQQLRKRKYDIIFDDDDSGEAADVVTIRKKNKSIGVEFYHCKFSGELTPGSRISDLYAVCGQAQKCIHWMDNKTGLFAHLLRRDSRRIKNKRVTRFEKGDSSLLHMIKEMSRTMRLELSVFIVQPGLSRANASDDQLQLLGVTQNYLMETYKLPFGVIASL